jgi:hypothetical protein
MLGDMGNLVWFLLGTLGVWTLGESLEQFTFSMLKVLTGSRHGYYWFECVVNLLARNWFILSSAPFITLDYYKIICQ